MTTLELQREASRIPVPVDPRFGRARAYVQVVDGRYQAYFGLDGGIRREPAGPFFQRPRDAGRFVDLLNGEASRPRLGDSAGTGVPASGDGRAEPEAPRASAAGACAVGGRDLPTRSRSHRTTCSPACRIAAFRQRAEAKATPAPVTVSEGPTGLDPATA